MWLYSTYAVAQIAAAVVAILLSIYCWGRRADRSALYFAILLIAVAEWSLFSGLEAAAVSPAAKIVFMKLQYFGIVSIAPLWLLFALSFSRQEGVLTRFQHILLWLVPVVSLILAWTNELHGLTWPSITPSSPRPGAALVYARGPAIWLHAIYAYILVAIGTAFVLRTAVRAPRLYRRQGLILIFGAAVPWFYSVIYVLGLGPVPHLDLTPIGFAVSGVLVTWSVFRFGFLSLAPVAYETLFAGMTDGVIALDAGNRIVAVNAAARTIMDLGPRALGRSGDEVFAAWPRSWERYRGATALQEQIPNEIPGRPGWTDVKIAPLFGNKGRLLGRLITLRDVTAQKRTEEARLASEGRFRLLVESAPEAIFVQTEGNFAYVNPAACRLFGADSAEALLGKPVMDRFHPDFRAVVADRIKALNLDRREVPRMEEIYLRLDGTPVDVEVSAMPILYEDKGGALVFASDITQRKRAEAALAEQSRRLRGIYDYTGDAIFLVRVEPDGRLVYEATNPAHRRSTGLEPEGLREKTPEEALPPEIAVHVRAHYEECLRRGEPYSYEETLDVPAGRKTWQTQLVPIPGPDGRFYLIAGVSRDITEQKRIEAAIRASDDEKSVLLKEIHHRVKNNMQVISSMLNLQSREIKDPGIMEMFRDTQTRIRSMALVHEKLYQSRDLARVDFASYLQSLIVHLFHAYRADPKRIKYGLAMEETLLDINTAIPLGLIVSELVSNALKYAFPGGRGGTLGIGLSPAPEGRLVLKVSDDGVGLPSDLDVRNAASLGLQIVAMLVEQLDGELAVGRAAGTEFRITFKEHVPPRRS